MCPSIAPPASANAIFVGHGAPRRANRGRDRPLPDLWGDPAAPRRVPESADRLPQLLRTGLPGTDRRRARPVRWWRGPAPAVPGRSAQPRGAGHARRRRRRLNPPGSGPDPAAGRLDAPGFACYRRAAARYRFGMATRRADEDLEGLSRSEVLRASPRMFDWELFEKFSRVHWTVPPLIFVPTITILLIEGFVHGVGWMAAVWIPGGYLFWTLTEYWLHRVVFHFEPEKGIGAKLHWIIHGVHHDHPNDPLRLVMPPALSVPLAALFVWVFSLVIGSPGFLPFGAAFLAGYLGYDMLHYHVHHHRPKTALGKRLRELHMRHHFQNHERGYGVSAPFWDHVFGTAPKKIR